MEEANLIARIREKTQEILPQVIALRRTIHQHPELGEQEEATCQLICQELDQLGIPWTKGPGTYAVTATIYGQDRSHAVGIRADMDALPITEATGKPWQSQNPGVMHACGHDIHTAILLGTAMVLSSMADALPGSIRLFFQPAEETIGGAEAMIATGCLQNPNVTSTISLHTEPMLDAGTIHLCPGPMNAASSDFSVTVRGKSTHGAHPDNGIDAIVTACAMIQSLQAIVTRRIPPEEPGLITVGSIHGGQAANVVAGEVVFTGIFRTFNMERRAFIAAQIQQVCQQTALAYGAEVDVVIGHNYPALINDDALLTIVRESATEVLGDDAVLVKSKPSLGADDFAYFCQAGRGVYYNLGTHKPGDPNYWQLHSDHFDPDEASMETGILTECAAAIRILQQEAPQWKTK